MAFQQQNRINVNGRIRAREVRVIIAATKEQLGIMQIVDFGKYRYELAKQEKDRKHSTAKLKEVKFRVNIDEHDYTTKLRRAEEFLDKGSKVKVQLQFRGREMAHKELGDQLMRRVRDDLTGMSAVEMEPKHAGRSINMTLSPLPLGRRKRRFKPMDEEEIAAAEAAESAEETEKPEDDHDED